MKKKAGTKVTYCMITFNKVYRIDKFIELEHRLVFPKG